MIISIVRWNTPKYVTALKHLEAYKYLTFPRFFTLIPSPEHKSPHYKMKITLFALASAVLATAVPTSRYAAISDTDILQVRIFPSSFFSLISHCISLVRVDT
jgi:hypothetical protein